VYRGGEEHFGAHSHAVRSIDLTAGGRDVARRGVQPLTTRHVPDPDVTGRRTAGRLGGHSAHILRGGRPPAMNIVVCVKQVPDTWAEKKLTESDKTVDRENVDGVMNELDEYAVEEALKIKEAQGDGQVTVFTMGPAKATETIRKALSMGADAAVHLVDDGLKGSDALTTSYAVSKALGTLDWDVVICGSESTDARMGVFAPMLAERLGAAQLSLARKVETDGTTIKIERQTDVGYDVVEASTPAVVSVVEKINEPRYPSFKGIMAAKKKPLTTLSLADAGVEPGSVGGAASGSEVTSFAPRPPKEKGEIVSDEGDGGSKLADYLAGQKII
jgi:electron transfer flavoprotein beta subunit